MGFSNEWDEAYKNGTNLSIWPWTELISMFYHFFPKSTTDYKSLSVLELGCGAGANIPFFVSIGVDYYSIEGSTTEVNLLNEKYKESNVTIDQGDFTKGIPYSKKFDLIFDRAAVCHNSSDDIEKVVDFVFDSLKDGGYYFGINWFSTNELDFKNSSSFSKRIDDKTFQFTEGIYGKLGNVHFTDVDEIKTLFKNFEICDLYENKEEHLYPESWIRAQYSFAYRKGLSK